MQATFLLLALGAISGVLAGYNANSKSNVAVYWGQNSFGRGSGDLAQQRLSHYCQNPDIDIILLAFLLRFNGAGGQPILNFANQGDKCTLFPGTETFNCPEIAADISTCQSAGKTILLSIGGDAYNEGGFTTPALATSAANKIWAMFGPQQAGSNALRPFGSSTIDGFDLDYEAIVQNAVPFASTLRSLMDSSAGKKRYLTAAPQCPYPDAYNAEVLNNVPFDIVWPQFYNNYCGLDMFVPGASDQWNYNFNQWDNWAKTVSKNRDAKVMIGVPGNTGAAGRGYVGPDRLAEIFRHTKERYSSFGGVMVWDASQVVANQGFLGSVKNSLRALARRGMRWGLRSEGVEE